MVVSAYLSIFPCVIDNETLCKAVEPLAPIHIPVKFTDVTDILYYRYDFQLDKLLCTCTKFNPAHNIIIIINNY